MSGPQWDNPHEAGNVSLFISKGLIHPFVVALPLCTDRGIVNLQLISDIGSILVPVLLKSQEQFLVLPSQRRMCSFPRDVSAHTMKQIQTTHHNTRQETVVIKSVQVLWTHYYNSLFSMAT